jgi:CO/xanthine dehydrogenase Mo-binding subunit
MSEEASVIGRPHWRVDGIGKVTGQARFAADLSAAGMLWGGVLLARRPHARLLSVDPSPARAICGVHAVVTGADLPFARTFGTVIQHQPVIVFDRVRHYGDGVAIVAAESPLAVRAALEAIQVVYEDLPGVFDPEEAMRPGAPLVHEPSNVIVHHPIRTGDAARGLAEADLVLERTYRTQFVEHAYLEPEAVLAEQTEDGGIRVTGSIQNIFSTRRSLAEVLGLDLARVTIKHATLGGSFGGKDEVMTQMACRASLLARATGRPVKMVNTREESMAESYKRHPYVLHYKAGATKDGTITAIEARIVADAGAYAATSPFVTWRSAVQVTGPYECANVRADIFAAHTNNCYTGAMRGFGAPQVNFAVESLVDELAERLEIDPVEFRMKNAVRRGSVTATGQRLEHEVSVREVLERTSDRAGWAERRRRLEKENARATDGRRRGIGMACSYRGVSLGAEGTDAVGALVSVQSDGSAIVTAGLTDMGQGVGTALSLIAAEVLGIDPKRITYFNVHTGRVPDSGPTVASRSTLMGGQAVKRAAEMVRGQLLEVVAERRGLPLDQLTIRRGLIQGPSGMRVSVGEAVQRAYASGKPLLGFGWFKPPTTTWNEKSGKGDAYFTFVYSANVAEVEVDLETGRVELLGVTAAHDVGRAISPAMIRSQVGGGIAMGMGYALLERYELADGVPGNRNFDEYLIATAPDVPEIDLILVENPDALGPFGAKSVGEPATEIAAPAIVNAVAHATGRRITALPGDLETVLLGRPLDKPQAREGT